MRGAARLRLAALDGFDLISPRGVPEIVEDQARSLRLTAIVLSFFGTDGIVLLMTDFASQFGAGGRLTAYSIVAMYVVWFTTALAGGRQPWFLNVSLAFLMAQGTLWGLMVFRMAEVATERQSNFVIALAMALVSTPMLGAPFSIAFAFWLPVAIGTAVAVGWGLHPTDPYLGTAFVFYEAFTLFGIFFINKTLLERSKAQLALKTKNATVSLLLRDYEENAADWLWETDADVILRHVTPRFAQVLSCPILRVEGIPFAKALGLDRKRDPSTHELLEAMSARRTFRDLAIRALVAGEDRWWSLSGRPVEDVAGRFVGYRGVGSDVTEAKRAEEATRYLATHDALTGVGNRRMFHERMTEVCRVSEPGLPSEPFALLMMDLDRFKDVNDDHGHEAGDQVLNIVARQLKRGTRPGDHIARLGGDEFAVIMPGAGPREAAARAKQLIDLVSEQMRVGEAWLSVGASVGIANFPADGHNMAEMSRSADLALYRSKEGGRGTFCIYNPSYNVAFKDRVALLADLKMAIVGATGLTVHYQPIVDIATGVTISREALCRWFHPERGEIPPSVFIPLAEECGLIGRLGVSVLRQACIAACSWGPYINVSVNLSPLQLKDPGLSTMVASVLRQSGLDPARLELEVTESAWLKGDAQTRNELRMLEELGAQLVLDDFGTGYSSLSALHSFRFQGLKLDSEFTKDLERDPKAGAIVRLVSQLAAELGIALTAEGIETEAQLEIVRSFGVSRVQGFLIGRPLSYENRLVEPNSHAALVGTPPH